MSNGPNGEATAVTSGGAPSYQAISPSKPSASAGHTPKEVRDLLTTVLDDAFLVYNHNHNGTLEKKEFRLFLRDFHERLPEKTFEELFHLFDVNHDGTISYDETVNACYVLIKKDATKVYRDDHEKQIIRQMFLNELEGAGADAGDHDDDDGDNDGEEQETLPSDISQLAPAAQQSALKRRAFMLAAGTTLAIVFSDPLVRVLIEMASPIGISPFYVGFALAPWGSNASEVIVNQYYAAKKTRKSITVSLTALEGAGAMSNTFCLSVFMGLIYFRRLAWQYTAETVTIVTVEYIAALSVQNTNKMSTMQGFMILAVYPLSLAFVAVMEYCGTVNWFTKDTNEYNLLEKIMVSGTVKASDCLSDIHARYDAFQKIGVNSFCQQLNKLKTLVRLGTRAGAYYNFNLL